MGGGDSKKLFSIETPRITLEGKMSAICGIIGFGKNAFVKAHTIVKMRDVMSHRGPDDAGFYVKGNISLGHRRLSVIDLSPNGRQPLSNEDKTVWIVCNGEFYNYSDYIKDLVRNGHILKSATDTEVILHLYEDLGLEETLKRINGMFAFCIVDFRKNVSFLVRDRFGIKPLYYTVNKNRIAFASEIKAFFSLPDYQPRLRIDAIQEFYLYNRMLDFSTLLEDTHEVRPGTYLEIHESKIKEKQYYNLKLISENRTISEEEAIDELDYLLTESIKYRLVSDVPLGVFLSGGLDSSIIALKAAKLLGKPINTITSGYPEKEANEFDSSDNVAVRIGANNRKFLDNSEDFFNLFPYLTYMYDGPLLAGVSFYKAARFSKETCTVMLCGQGSDETFAGYTSYIYGQWQYFLNRLIRKTLGHRITSQLAASAPRIGKRKLYRKVIARLYLNDFQTAAAYSGSIPGEDFLRIFNFGNHDRYNDVLNKYEALWPKRSDLDFLTKMLYAEMFVGLQTVLQMTDRMTMAVSVETRVPFLDHRLVEFIYSLPSKYKVRKGIGKYILKKYLLRYFDREFVYRPKKGFPVPLTQWFLKGEFRFPKKVDRQLLDVFDKNYIEEYQAIVRSRSLGTDIDAIFPILRYISLQTWLSVWHERWPNSGR